MINYIINKIINFFTSDEKLEKISNSLISSIICTNIGDHTVESIIIDKMNCMKTIGGKRYVNFIGSNVSGVRFSIMICDIGVIHMSRVNNVFKHMDHMYSVYIKEI